MTVCVNCQLCSSDDVLTIKKEGEWNIVQCKNCGFVYVNPRPDENFLKRHYQNYLPTNQHRIEGWKRMMYGVFKKSLSIIEDLHQAKPGKLLDIGCGHGFFLQMATEKEWDGYGVDLSKQAVSYARSRGLNVSDRTLFEKKYNDEEFDVITMFYILEHLPDPAEYLREVYRILKPKGILVVRVPHTTPIVKILKLFGIPNKLYSGPSHLSDFSPKTIKWLLQKVGFKDIRTIIGGMTYPVPLMQRLISVFFGSLATFLSELTFGRYLLPGVSKTTIAIRQNG